MPDPGLQDYLNQLLAQRATLNIQIAGVRAALGMDPEDESVAGLTTPLPGPMNGSIREATTGRIRADEFFRMSIPEAIKKYLDIMKQPQQPKAIADGIKSGGILSDAKNFYANVATAIKRLKDQGVVINTKSGGWALAEWYAGRSGGLPDTKIKGKGKGKKVGKGKRGPKAGRTTTTTKRKKPPSEYQAFVSEQRKIGKTMKEVGAAWRAQKGEV